MKVPFELFRGLKPLEIEPITTKTEKSILEFSVMTEDPELVYSNVVETLGIPKDLPLDLQMAMIYKIREISFGGDLKLSYKCPCCGRVTESVLVLEDLLEYLDSPKVGPALRQDLTFSEIMEARETPMTSIPAYYGDQNQILEMVANDTPVGVARYLGDLKRRVLSMIPSLKKTLPSKCMFCGHHREVRIADRRFCIESLSEHTVVTMYKTYFALVRNGFTKQDIDSMLPFEREVYLKLAENLTSQKLGKQGQPPQPGVAS